MDSWPASFSGADQRRNPKPVVDPPAIALLFYQACRLHQFEVSAGVRLRHLKRLNELTNQI